MLDNVAAYRAVYEEIKKVDPTIPVVATSVEPNEEYFKAGYGKYCDAFDFHIYEEYANVRRTIGEYRALMKKYDCEKPIWSTELGLNSQGQTRHVVAVELVKKFATFFAAGGENLSWFGLLYPDADGKSAGSSATRTTCSTAATTATARGSTPWPTTMPSTRLRSRSSSRRSSTPARSTRSSSATATTAGYGLVEGHCVWNDAGGKTSRCHCRASRRSKSSASTDGTPS